jgi:hypothetical protein
LIAALAAVSASAVWFCAARGYTLYYGDAEAHLNIARRIFDSRTPGPDQLGTAWLPLPHILMLPVAGFDPLWRSGLAGAIPSAAAYIAGGAFLFAAVRRLFGTAPAAAATAVCGLNPNLLYLQSTPMNEPLQFGCLMALLYCTIRSAQTGSVWFAAAGGIAAAAGTLTRYESWFVLPFVTLYLAFAVNRSAAAVFAVIAAAGPLSWMAHNRWWFSDALEFYWGPYSARAIQGNVDYPGKNDWLQALLYYRTAARLCTGPALYWLGGLGVLAALFRRAWWPVVLLSLPCVFYVWGMHSAGNPIFVPELWPNSYYNTRYAIPCLALASFGIAALAALAPQRMRAGAAVLLVLAASTSWLAAPIVWKEGQVNSESRRAWTREAAAYIAPRYRSGAGLFTSFGDLTGIYRTAGIPLRETLTGDNGPHWLGATARPDLFLWEEWAVAMGGDRVQRAINRAGRMGPYYTLARRIAVKNAPVIEIYRRQLPEKFYVHPFHQSARSEERFSADVGR